MTAFKKTSAFLLASVAVVLLVRHGETALKPVLPVDMPVEARFMQSGFDVTHFEPSGQWVACGSHAEQQTNWCRITDSRGEVVYEGDFLPLNGGGPLPTSSLDVNAGDVDRLWAAGPDNASIPIVPLVNGVLLVPADDRDALADRWTKNPEELAQLQAR